MTMESSVRDLLAQVGPGAGGGYGRGQSARPARVDWRTGVVYSPPNLPGWSNVPLADIMRERLGVPCYVENDANAAC